MTDPDVQVGTAMGRRRVASAITLTGLFCAGFLAFGIGVYAFTQFLAPIQQEFGWGRAVMGGMMSAFWLAAPFVLLASYTLDRVGIRAMVIGGAAVEAAGLALMVWVSSPLEFFLVRFLMGVGKVIAVTPLPIAVARWFPRWSGVALAVVLCGWHVGGLVMAPAAAALILAYGWRISALLLAAVIFAVMVLASTLIRHPNPQREADTSSVPKPIRSSLVEESSATPARARVVVLAAIGFGTFAFYTGYAGLLSQLSPLLSDAGFSAHAIGEATGSVAVSAMVGVLVCGVLTQLLSSRVAGAAVLLLMGLVEVGTTTLGAGAGTAPLAVFVIVLGLLIGGGDPILIEALRRTVPSRRFNHAYGWWYLVCLTALAAAPVLAGAAFDRDANYLAAFSVMGGVSALAAALWLYVLRTPRVSSRLPPMDLQSVVGGKRRRVRTREKVDSDAANGGSLS